MAVFGDTDIRREFYEIGAADRKELCRSVGAIVDINDMPLSNGFIDTSKLPAHAQNILDNPELTQQAITKGTKLNSIDETQVRFTAQRTLGAGTAFLVADDIIATAAHVIFPYTRVNRAISDLRFVLDFWYTARLRMSVPETSIFQVKEIILQTHDFKLDQNPGFIGWRGVEDFTFLRLQRKVEDRHILQFGIVDPVLNDPLWSVGHASQLPLKYKENDRGCRGTGALDKKQTYRHALTTYPGDSGSPIFNAHNQVVGIATSGWSLPGNFLVTDQGIVEPVYLPLAPNDADDKKMTYAYRSTVAQWLINPDAYLKAILTFEDAENGESETFDIEIGTFVGTVSAPFTADEFEIEIDCTPVLAGQPRGLLGLDFIWVQLDTPSKPKDASVRRLSSMTFIVSQDGASQSVQVMVAGLDKPLELKNGDTNNVELAKILPLQRG